MKGKVLNAIKHVKREQWLIGIILGALLLVVATPVKTEKKDEEGETLLDHARTENVDEVSKRYEQQLEEILVLVQGVGSVRVAITMESSGKKLVEKDVPTSLEKNTQKDSDGSENISEQTNTEETTIYEETASGEQIPYVISETYPEIRGVVVVAQGGDDPVIVKQIQEAVMALFHMEAHKIKVLKMK